MSFIQRYAHLCAAVCLLAPAVSRAADIYSTYQIRPALQFSLPNVAGSGLGQGPSVFDVLADGRILAVVTQIDGSNGVPKLYVQHALHSTIFDPLDTLPAPFFPTFGASFLVVSPDGTKAAINDNDFDVGVFSTAQPLAGSKVTSVNWLDAGELAFNAAWLDNNRLAVTGAATIGAGGQVSILDTSKAQNDPSFAKTIITGLNSSSGIVFDYDTSGNPNNLYTAEGFGSGAQPTGQIRKFTQSQWQGSLTSGVPLDFSVGSVVATFSSAASLDIDTAGNLIVAGFPTPSDGVGVLKLSDPSQKRTFDPASTTGNTYYTVYNPVTGEIYVNEQFPAGGGSNRTVYVIAPAPEPGTFALAAAGIGIVLTHITLKKKGSSLMKKCIGGKFTVGLLLAGAMILAEATSAAVAGPYTNLSVSASDPAIAEWASSVANFSPTPTGSTSGSDALGPADSTSSVTHAASLGDLTADEIAAQVAPGSITVKFSTPFRNGAGWDLAVFENAGTFFTAPFVFGELAYVEVSSDGTNFARFPSISLNTEPGAGTADTDLITTFGRDFAGLNPTNTHNLAGIHPAGQGTEFELDDLLTDALVTGGLVNLNALQYVRIVDIPGNGSFLDSAGHPILDAWPSTNGFDADAVGARFVPEPTSILLALSAAVSLWCCRRARRHPK